jgi:hypothetical protein
MILIVSIYKFFDFLELINDEARGTNCREKLKQICRLYRFWVYRLRQPDGNNSRPAKCPR